MNTFEITSLDERIDILSELEAIELLKSLDDAYYNDEPLVPDEDYDRVRKQIQNKYPTNGYFRQVGSAVRGAEIKHNMPVAGLKQLYTVEEVQAWAKNNGFIVASSKLDGSSATITYVNRKLISAATRGDGIYGKDITRHILNFPGVPKVIDSTSTLDIRGELIISKANFPKVQELLLKLKGREYKNARNTIVGLINGKEIPDEVFPYLEFVAYDIAGSLEDKTEQFSILEDYDFKIPSWKSDVQPLNEDVLSYLMKELKDNSEYDCDGIVLDINASDLRQDLMPTEDDLNPGYGIKWKPNAEEAMRTAKVIGLEWNVSKDNYIKPVVLIDPIELGGVTIQRLTGFNMKFITDNMISTGATIKFCRSGDVIPHIVDVIEKATALDLPDLDWEWNETKVDAVAIEETERAHLLKLRSFFAGLEVESLQEASIQKMIDAQYDTIEKIILAEEHEFESVFGKNGSKAYKSLHKFLQNCDLSTLIGSWPYFGRGFGKRKAKALLDGVSDFSTCTKQDILKIDGFSDKTADLFLKNRQTFIDFYKLLEENEFLKVKQEEVFEGEFSGQSFAFTGIRSAEAEEKIKKKGGIIHDGMKKDTTWLIAKDPKAGSHKLDKARKQGTKVISFAELYDIIDSTPKKSALVF